MKNLLTKPSKPHRPTPRLLFTVVGAILLSSVAYTQNASAISLPGLKSENKSFLSPLQENKNKLAELDKTFSIQKEKLQDRQEIVDKAKEEAAQVVSNKEQLTKQLEELKAEIEQLDDMFVRIASYAANAAGNNYALGNCTWYAKSKRPDIPNSMGNANMWYSAAAANGFNVGTKAKVGAVATTQEGWAGHVAYVEKVSRDGSLVTISEMNYGGLYKMNTRTVAASSFKYIYEKP